MELPLVNVSTCELRSVIRFFTAKNETAVNIHRNLVSVYGEECMSIQMVRRWRSWFLEGRQNVHDDEQGGRPVTATDNAAVAAVRNVVEADRRVTIDEIIIRCLLESKLDAIRLEQSSRAFLEMHQRDRDQLFSRIVTGDESWVHHSTPETKRQSMVWKKPEETLKWHLGGKHFANDDEVQAEENHWLRRQDTAWYNSGIKNCYNGTKNVWTEMICPRTITAPEQDTFHYHGQDSAISLTLLWRTTLSRTISAEEPSLNELNESTCALNQHKLMQIDFLTYTRDFSPRTRYTKTARIIRCPDFRQKFSKITMTRDELANFDVDTLWGELWCHRRGEGVFGLKSEKVLWCGTVTRREKKLKKLKVKEAKEAQGKLKAKKLKKLKRPFVKGLKELKKPFVKGLKELKKPFVKGLKELKKPFVKGLKELKRPFVKGLKELKKPFVKGLKELKKPFVKGLKELKKPFVKGLKELKRPFVKGLKELKKPFVKGLKELKKPFVKGEMEEVSRRRRKAIRGVFTEVVNDMNTELRDPLIDKSGIYAKFDRLESLHLELVALNERCQAILLAKDEATDDEIDKEFEDCEVYITERYYLKARIRIMREQDRDAQKPIIRKLSNFRLLLRLSKSPEESMKNEIEGVEKEDSVKTARATDVKPALAKARILKEACSAPSIINSEYEGKKGAVNAIKGKETEAAVICNEVKDSAIAVDSYVGVREAEAKDKANEAEAKPDKVNSKDGDKGDQDSEAKPKGEGVKESEANPKDEGIKDSEDEPKGDGVNDSEDEPKGDGVKDSEDEPKGDGVKDSEDEPKGDGVRDSKDEPKGDGVKDSKDEPKGDGVKDSKDEPKGDGVKDSEDEPKGDGVNDPEARPTGDTESKIKNKEYLQNLKGNPGDWLSRWGQFGRNNANEKYEEANLKDKEDSEAKPKGDGVKDSETAIKGYKPVSNSRAVAEGTDSKVEEEKIDAEQGTDSRVEENPDAEQGTESRMEEGIIDAKDWLNNGFIEGVDEIPPEGKGYWFPDRPVFGCESETTPIRPVCDGASCRRRSGLSLRRYLKKIPNLLRRILEIGIKLRKNKYGVLADVRKYFQVMAIRENDWDYLRFLWKRKMDAYGATSDIAPNDFFLFTKLKAVLKGRHFDTRDDIIEKSLLPLKSIPKEAYKNCFDNWEKRWRWCVEARRDY
ncbi:hypothetical protein LAZ67_7001563 [Cordylochernes scorpioides]|uniref:Mos1 transposase HTH domain-containing protein n=1 Tax=Cordylochernes scorpioides TaxID=51811 RepID=A0ABY6KMF2_9ARAC|nr:hypothetical protein LAZ67_7001563 [Cordylochernes scorpioides]